MGDDYHAFSGYELKSAGFEDQKGWVESGAVGWDKLSGFRIPPDPRMPKDPVVATKLCGDYAPSVCQAYVKREEKAKQNEFIDALEVAILELAVVDIQPFVRTTFVTGDVCHHFWHQCITHVKQHASHPFQAIFIAYDLLEGCSATDVPLELRPRTLDGKQCFDAHDINSLTFSWARRFPSCAWTMHSANMVRSGNPFSHVRVTGGSLVDFTALREAKVALATAKKACKRKVDRPPPGPSMVRPVKAARCSTGFLRTTKRSLKHSTDPLEAFC